jgi:hypothetical protein
MVEVGQFFILFFGRGNKLNKGFFVDFSYFGGAESLSDGRSPRRTVVDTPNSNDDGLSYQGVPQDPSDFLWLMTEEPHRSRRMDILKAHPEVRRFSFQVLTQHRPIDNERARVKGHKTHGI